MILQVISSFCKQAKSKEALSSQGYGSNCCLISCYLSVGLTIELNKRSCKATSSTKYKGDPFFERALRDVREVLSLEVRESTSTEVPLGLAPSPCHVHLSATVCL